MRVFVLGSGRCGSVTMSRACGHATNFTVLHESLASMYGAARFAYPDGHIEVDPRLSWFLGDLVVRFPEALYVHLVRDEEATAHSIARRWHNGRIGFARAFGESMVMRGRVDDPGERLELSRFLVRTVRSNIALALASVPRCMEVKLEEAPEWFPEFWRRIGAQGDLGAAVAEWGARYNASPGVATC